MRIIIILGLLILTPITFASPYVEYKNELKFKDRYCEKEIHHIRLGYQTKKNFYFEAGPRTGGFSSEVGYKVKRGAFTFKGKWEGSRTEDFKHKVQTEVRYTWD